MMARLLVLLLLFTACRALPPAETEDDGKILFLAYQVEKDTINSIHRFGIIHQLLSEGSFHQEPMREPVPGDLILVFYNRKGREILRTVIADPLTEYAEGVNDAGRLVRISRNKLKGELLARVPYTRDMKKISILLAGETDKKLFEHDVDINQ